MDWIIFTYLTTEYEEPTVTVSFISFMNKTFLWESFFVLGMQI